VSQILLRQFRSPIHHCST